MAKKHFSNSEWNRINTLMKSESESYGLPDIRQKSVVIGSFNIRSLGKLTSRSTQSRDFLEAICRRFDLLAIQEVRDDLEGIRELKERLGNSFGLVVSDTTGVFPGSAGSGERLAFLFQWKRLKRTELASDITFDRTKVIGTLLENRLPWGKYLRDLETLPERIEKAKENDEKKPKKPVTPSFLTFIRQPHCASFEVVPKGDAKPISFLAINAHLLYGDYEVERTQEFFSLIEWLTLRAKKRDRTYADNLILLGDCNLEFDDINMKRIDIDDFLKSRNKAVLSSKKAATANFPFLSPHPNPELNPLRTNARKNQTYDQIGIFSFDKRLPSPDDNQHAGQLGPDGYDYGVFRFVDLFAAAVFEDSFEPDVLPNYLDLNASEKKHIIDRTQWDVSDHMPTWFRLPIPGV